MCKDVDLASQNAQLESLLGATSAERDALLNQLAETVRLNELFAGILSHDLRNPLGAILMSATVLSRKLNDPDLVRTAGRIVTAGQRMNRMIGQLLDFTRLRSARECPITRTHLDLSSIMRQAIDENSEAVDGSGVKLVCEGQMWGWWDAERLAQLCSNLVSNALRYGEPPAPVTVQVDGQRSTHIVFSVRNAGTIPSNLAAVIWEPFQRGELRERRTGLGLGLFISRQIVLAHGGSATFASIEGDTIVTVDLPRGMDPQSV